VLSLLASKLKEIFNDYPSIHVFADHQGLQASETPQATIPSTLLTTPYRPDIVVYNSDKPSVALVELTCPLDSEHNIHSVRSRKQNMVLLKCNVTLAHAHQMQVLQHLTIKGAWHSFRLQVSIP